MAGCAKTPCANSSTAAERADWVTLMGRRHVIPLDNGSAVAVKRDVRRFEIEANAKAFAEAFHAAMMDPNTNFGLIKIDRLPQNVGKPFHVGERFQGRYQLDLALDDGLRGEIEKLVEDASDTPGGQDVLCSIESSLLSDYGEITLIELAPPEGQPFRIRYEYLSGSPIAGSSTFVVEPVDATHCRFVEIFQYQEISSASAAFFSAVGLKAHNGVVTAQVAEAIKRVPGAKVLSSDIPYEKQ